MIYAIHYIYDLKKEAALGLPQIRVRFLADRNSRNANGTSNLKTVRQKINNRGRQPFLHYGPIEVSHYFAERLSLK